MSAAAFRFVSSYRGEAEYRRRADGRRYRVRLADPLRLPSPTDGGGTPPEVLAEWHAFRLAQRAELDRWAERRPGLDLVRLAEVRAEDFPDLVDEPGEVTP